MSAFSRDFACMPPLSSTGLLLLTILSSTALAGCPASDAPTPPQTPPPGNCRILSPAVEISFPFEVYRGDIRYPCAINGHNVFMLLDDGFMWDDLLFWGGPAVDSLGLLYEGSLDVKGSANAENGIMAKTASGITVRFPGVEFTDQRAVVMPSSSGTSTMWRGSHGQISAMLFKHFVVNIDFDKMMITLIDPAEYEYKGAGVAIPWEPLGFGPWGIPARMGLADGREVSLKLLMDLGYNDQLQLALGKENGIPLPKRILPANLGINIQGVPTMGYVGRLPWIEIGKYTIKDVLVAYAAEDNGLQAQEEAMIGLGLLSRFNLVFDYSRQRLIIEPNATFGTAFEYDMSGLSMRMGTDGALDVADVFDDSPAAEAGLRVGDVITRINGRRAGEIDLHELLAVMTQKGKTVKLTARRDGREWDVKLVLRRVI